MNPTQTQCESATPPAVDWKARAEKQEATLKLRALEISAVVATATRIENDLRGELARSNMCDVCAGTGVPASGLPCICNGTGKMSEAAVSLRLLLIDSQKRAEKAESELANLRVADEATQSGLAAAEDELELLKAELGISRDDLRDEQCAARSDRRLKDQAVQRGWGLEAELDRLRRQNAAMREALKWQHHECHACHPGEQCPDVCVCSCPQCHMEHIKRNALKDDAGSTLLTRESVMPLVKALQHYERWKYSGTASADRALEHAHTLGLINERKA